MSTNIENYLLLIEELNKTIDGLVLESDPWTGSTLSGTNKDIKGGESDDDEKVKDEIKEKWGENFVGEDDTEVYEILTEDEWVELVGEDGADAVKNLSNEDIGNLLLLKGAPKVRGYLLKSGKYAGKMVVKPLLKSSKVIKGLIAGKKLTSILGKRASKSSGFCFCNELAEEFDDATSNGKWKKIRRNIYKSVENGTYTEGQGKVLIRNFDKCEDDLGTNVTDFDERKFNARDCEVMKDALAGFDSAMGPIISMLNTYFRTKEKESSKTIKGKSVGGTLAGAKEIKFKFTEDKDVTQPGGSICTSCFNNGGNDGKIFNTNTVTITPLGGEGDRTIRCKWNNQKSGVGYILMTFEHANVGDNQTVEFVFYDSSGTKMSQKTSVSGIINRIDN
jgi:hypothetical protein